MKVHLYLSLCEGLTTGSMILGTYIAGYMEPTLLGVYGIHWVASFLFHVVGGHILLFADFLMITLMGAERLYMISPIAGSIIHCVAVLCPLKYIRHDWVRLGGIMVCFTAIFATLWSYSVPISLLTCQAIEMIVIMILYKFYQKFYSQRQYLWASLSCSTYHVLLGHVSYLEGRAVIKYVPPSRDGIWLPNGVLTAFHLLTILMKIYFL